MTQPMGQMAVSGQGEVLPELDVFQPERQRRWTVLLRALLVLPQYVVLIVLTIAAGVVMVIAWFGALVLGRLPAWCADFLGGYLQYSTRVYSYLLLLVDTYPPFQWMPQDHPVSVELARGRLNRAAVLFRLILYVPAGFMTAFLQLGWMVLALFFWLTVLILGQNPRPVFGATAAVVRYTMRAQAYFVMLTSAYPKRLFGDRAPIPAQYPAPPAPGASPPSESSPDPPPTPGSYPQQPRGHPPSRQAPPWAPSSSSTRPLLLSSGARALLILIIVLGVLYYFGSPVLRNRDLSTDGTLHQNAAVAALQGCTPLRSVQAGLEFAQA
jgi:uncharacterized protein DUF4389